MRGLKNPFPAPGAVDVHRQFSFGPPLLLSEEAPWKKAVSVGFLGLTSHITKIGDSDIKAGFWKEFSYSSKLL